IPVVTTAQMNHPSKRASLDAMARWQASMSLCMLTSMTRANVVRSRECDINAKPPVDKLVVGSGSLAVSPVERRLRHPRSRLSELVVDKVQGDVQDRGGVGQPTDAEEVDTRLGIRPRNLQGQPTRGLDLNALAGGPHCLDRLTQRIHGHVVAQQEPRPCGHGFESLSRGRDLHLYVHGRVGQMNSREGSGDRTS